MFETLKSAEIVSLILVTMAIQFSDGFIYLLIIMQIIPSQTSPSLFTAVMALLLYVNIPNFVLSKTLNCVLMLELEFYSRNISAW